MPKVKLTFKLPDEAIEARTALDAEKWKSIVWDLKQEIRDKLKYGDLTEAQAEVYEIIRKSLFEKLQDAGLSLD